MNPHNKPDIWGACVYFGIANLIGAVMIRQAFTWPTPLDRWNIAVEGERLDEQLCVVRERYEHRQALPSSPSLNSLKSEGGE